MGIAGAAGGAARSLEELVTQQLLKQRLMETIAEREQAQALESARLNETMRNNEFNRTRTERIDKENAEVRQRGMDREDTERRGRSNMAQVIGMGVDPQTTQREVAFSALNSGADVPSGVAKLLEGPPAPKKYPVRTVDGQGRPVQRLATEEEMGQGVPEYREPKAPTKPERDPIADYEAKLKLDAEYKQPGNAGPSAYSQERSARTIQSVDELMGKVSGKTTGWGNLAAAIPGSDALNFESELDTLKANIAFNELTAMREASKTGGALGQVSNIELRLLESALGALNPRQSPANLKAQLEKIKGSIGRWQQASGIGNMTPATSGTPNAGGGSLYEQYLARKKGGG